MKNPLCFKTLLPSFGCLLFSVASADAGMIVQHFGPNGTDAPVTITELGTTIGADLELPSLYQAQVSSNSDIQFVRYIIDEDECTYWFRDWNRADGDPVEIGFIRTESYSSVYWYAGDFVDSAVQGNNNFVVLYSTSVQSIVGVVQYDFDVVDNVASPARLLAYAVNMEGMTFQSGVTAIQAIPEPSTVVLFSLTAFGGMLLLRRRR